ncbi:hypothetical protein [Ensifer canadensis]
MTASRLPRKNSTAPDGLIAAADAAALAGIGAFTFEGKFVDLPIVTRARGLLARTAG